MVMKELGVSVRNMPVGISKEKFESDFFKATLRRVVSYNINAERVATVEYDPSAPKMAQTPRVRLEPGMYLLYEDLLLTE
ncbi:hypothetical protein [Pseudomonas sp. efr-133-TYG-5]|uniref:hypothetical protein n=1 Tax=Pseudomonas sp. efr-133-TYG-5 TaxID=3040310 RepID=UPI00255587F3|nr:hypothetical protein [Pseudomonas sp. efr-133-TYG-5]